MGTGRELLRGREDRGSQEGDGGREMEGKEDT